jgi:vacuolar-type H+-ATPase subunit H
VKELIEKILEEEKRARELVEDARMKARQMRIEQDTKAQSIITEARETARKEGKERIARGEEEAEKEKERLLGQISRDMDDWMEKNQKAIESAADTVFREVTGGRE